ncbi:MAG TPA: copper chaperone PCu(A)C [Gammaproteobacteria bacterium]|nr:copper chaperone PCu(A)C [Gammaproteobacteria bacterium]
MRRLFLLLALCATCLPAVMADGPSMRVSHVWIREAPPGVDVLGGYFILENLTAKPLSLTEVSSPDFGSVMMHQTVQQGSQESMQEIARIDLPARGSVEFKPGGYHLMLMQPKKNLFAGDTVTLMLKFSDGSGLAILAPVRRDPPLH